MLRLRGSNMNGVQSPLFEPVLWNGDGFKILDELQVPERLEYIAVSEVDQALEAVRSMKTRAFGQVLVFLYAGALLAERHPNDDAAALRVRIAAMTGQFCDARPTFDFRGLETFFGEWLGRLPSGAAAGQAIAEQARQFARQIIRARLARARRAAVALPNPARVLTHCNVSGELVAVAQSCRELGKEFSVIATETRPYLQGARLTAWELAEAGVSVALIPDCAVTQVLARGEANAVIVGADRVAQNGDIINKVGTYPLALMAREYSVPFYALVQDPRSLQSGDGVEIEERPADELLKFRGEAIAGDAKIGARYPSFDVTPGALIRYLIGFDDLYTPESFRRKYQAKPAARAAEKKAAAKYLLIYGAPPPSQHAFLLSALKAEKATGLLVPEMRPELWGARKVARELSARQAPVTLISDNTMGTLFARGEILKLYLFCERMSEAGPVGICGSLLAAQLARLHGVPVELFDGAGSSDASLDKDVATFMGTRICPSGVTVPAVEPEIVPWSLFRSGP